jgi:thioredoxin reductase
MDAAPRSQDASYDTIIVGAGPAGLSAALVLGRCARRVLICDEGRPRNAASRGVNGFLTRDGIAPAELRTIGRAQLRPYPSVEVRDVAVTAAHCEGRGFVARLADGTVLRTRTLLLATGVQDLLPPIEGLAALWGRGVLHCPYCDGWEERGRRLGVIGQGEDGLSTCRALLGWTRDLVLFTNGPTELDPKDEERLARRGVEIVRERITRLVGRDGRLDRLEIEGRAPIARDAVFLHVDQRQRSPLVEHFGCKINAKGTVDTGDFESTDVPGLFVAGDASRNVQFAIIAAAEGAEAAFAINRTLARQDFEAA